MNCCRMLEVMNDFYPDEMKEMAGVIIVERIEKIGANNEVSIVGAGVGGGFQTHK